jgi:hypothetical protein
MKRFIIAATLLAAFAGSVDAQTAPAAAKPPVVVVPMADALQIASAVMPLPEEFRESATVLGYRAGQKGLVELRAGTGPYICLATEPGAERFHVACYHKSLEPFMARGRELRANGVKGAAVDSARYAEIGAGTLKLPDHAAALYSLTGKADSVDVAAGTYGKARPLYVVYLPYATAESTGLPTKPAPNSPWLMLPGTPKAHIMFVPTM